MEFLMYKNDSSDDDNDDDDCKEGLVAENAAHSDTTDAKIGPFTNLPNTDCFVSKTILESVPETALETAPEMPSLAAINYACWQASDSSDSEESHTNEESAHRQVSKLAAEKVPTGLPSALGLFEAGNMTELSFLQHRYIEPVTLKEQPLIDR